VNLETNKKEYISIFKSESLVVLLDLISRRIISENRVADTSAKVLILGSTPKIATATEEWEIDFSKCCRLS
jgi:hypothetical protein